MKVHFGINLHMARFQLLATCFVFALCSAPVRAQDDISQGVAQIIVTAENICGSIQATGSQSQIELEGEAEAELLKLSRRLLDLGIEGAANLSAGQYSGVLREQLGSELQDNRRCREKVFDAMFAVVFGATPETALDEEQLESLEGRVRPHSMSSIASGSDFSLSPGETVALNGNALIFTVDRLGLYNQNNRLFVYFTYTDGMTGQSVSSYVYQAAPIKAGACNIIPYRIDAEAQKASFRLFCN